MRLKRETQGAFCVFKRKRKITNAKIYEDKRDLYCTNTGNVSTHTGTVDCYDTTVIAVNMPTPQELQIKRLHKKL